MDLQASEAVMNVTTTPRSTGFAVNPASFVIPFGIKEYTAIVYACIALLGIIFNTSVISTFASSKDLRSPSIAYMINHSLSELLLCMVVLPFESARYLLAVQRIRVDIRTKQWMRLLGNALNQVNMHTVVAISLNRMTAISFPHAYKKLNTWGAVLGILCVVWISGFLVLLPSKFIDMGITAQSVYSVFYFVLPILTTITSYCVILFKVDCCHRSGETGDRSDSKQMTSAKEVTSLQRKPWKDDVMRTILVVLGILLVCSIPHTIMHIFDNMGMVTKYVWCAIHILYYIQLVLDPIVLVTVSSRYRRAFVKFLKTLCLCCGSVLQESKPSQSITATTPGSKHRNTEGFSESKGSKGRHLLHSDPNLV